LGTARHGALAANSSTRTGNAGAESAVRFVDVSKTYDGQTLVIDKLSLDVGKGEFLTLLGPSGSGKTTCLMMLAGFETPTSGEIWLKGARVDHMPPHKRGLGFVLQNYALFPHMTVWENLAFPLEVRRVSKSEIAKKIARALEMVELKGFGGRRPAQLSGGQQQRVAVARALVFEPEIVLMDEPLGALDKQLREQLQDEIRRIHRELGVTIVYVTHDQSEAMALSDRIAVFNHGRIEQVDSPRRLYDTPQTPFVASFIGENNCLDGKVVTIEGQSCRIALDANGEITALNAGGLSAGANTVVSIRPERVMIDPGADVPNRLNGVIEEFVYLGDHVRLKVSCGGELEIAVKAADGARERAFARGEKILLGFREEDARALAA
jgi:putative spermidine/putrescine transport system ATP-binding protein